MLIGRTLIFLTCGDKLLLLKGSRKKNIWPNLYNGTGGHIEPGENVLESALRELKEETGISSVGLNLCAIATFDASVATGVANFIFRGEAEQTFDVVSGEGDPVWVEKRRVMELPLVEDLYSLLPSVLKLKPSEPVLYFHYDRDQEGKLSLRFGPVDSPLV